MSPCPLSSPLLFSTISAPDFPNPSCWLSSIFSTLPFSLFTTKFFPLLPSSLPTNTSFHEPNVLAFTSDDTSTSFDFVHAIIDLSHPVPESKLFFSENVFNGWFDIPFPDTLSFTHVRVPHPSEILTLYGLSVLIPFYLTILSSIQIRALVLQIIPLGVTKYTTHIYFFHVSPRLAFISYPPMYKSFFHLVASPS